MIPDNVMAAMIFLAFATHTTVSFRNAPWLPLWLGQGCTEQSPSVHLRVSLCNGFYALLMFWLAFSRLHEPSGLLQVAFTLAALFCLTQFVRRGLLTFYPRRFLP
jgi:hypothetical protein